MKRILGKSVIGFGMLAIGMGVVQIAQAQGYGGPGYRDDRYRRDDGYRQDGFRGDNRTYALFDQVQGDLNRAANYGYLNGGQRRQIANASRDLAEFEGRWSRGRFDRHELDEAIGRIQKVVNHSGLNYRDRAALQEDVQRMRSFRAYEGGAQGPYNEGYGYRR